MYVQINILLYSDRNYTNRFRLYWNITTNPISYENYDVILQFYQNTKLCVCRKKGVLRLLVSLVFTAIKKEWKPEFTAA